MFAKITAGYDRLTRLPLGLHAGAAALAFGAFQLVQGKLNGLYAASQHPVDYKTGQLAFSADKIEGYYAAMQAKGTLDVYVQTQVFDYAFIAGTAVVGVLLTSLVARFLRRGSFARGLAMLVGALAVLGAGFDAVENLVSFVMLADPGEIGAQVARLYSGMAAAKFACLMPATTLFFMIPVVALVEAGVRRVRAHGAAAG